ncbi:MAG: DUF1475 family protein [Parvularculaceae bacterium]|nr:DUF1475 family protein [Parvularculaceae bacterium]
MTTTRILFAALGAGLLALIFWAMAADGRPLLDVLSGLFAQPWAVVTLADLYIGFAVSAAVILLTERRLWVGLFWAAPIFVLGNVWTAVWLVLRIKVLAARLRV